jgi:hypothetical protein
VNERQFLRLFPDQQDELKYFIKQNHIKFDMIPDLVRLIQYYNELKQ